MTLFTVHVAWAATAGVCYVSARHAPGLAGEAATRAALNDTLRLCAPI